MDISSLKDHGEYLEVTLHILDREMGGAPGLTSEELKLGLRTFQSKLSAGLGSEVDIKIACIQSAVNFKTFITMRHSRVTHVILKSIMKSVMILNK